MAIKMLKNGKVLGERNLTAELFKHGGTWLPTKMKHSINKTWQEEKIPEAWTLSIICPIHKKGVIMDCRNYRGISLFDSLYKILSNIPLTRLKPYGEEIIGEYKVSFRARG